MSRRPYVDDLWELARTTSLAEDGPPLLYRFAALLRTRVRNDALEEAAQALADMPLTTRRDAVQRIRDLKED